MAQPSGDVIDKYGDSVNAQAGCCLNKLFDSAVGWADFRKPNKSQTNPIFGVRSSKKLIRFEICGLKFEQSNLQSLFSYINQKPVSGALNLDNQSPQLILTF